MKKALVIQEMVPIIINTPFIVIILAHFGGNASKYILLVAFMLVGVSLSLNQMRYLTLQICGNLIMIGSALLFNEGAILFSMICCYMATIVYCNCNCNCLY